MPFHVWQTDKSSEAMTGLEERQQGRGRCAEEKCRENEIGLRTRKWQDQMVLKTLENGRMVGRSCCCAGLAVPCARQ